MSNKKIDYSNRRIIDYNPLNCVVKDDSIVIISPLSLMEDNYLFLPEKVRMSNGEITDKIKFESWSFFRTLSLWQNGPITLYAGKNYAAIYSYWVQGLIKEWERDYKLYFPNVNHINLYDVEEFEITGASKIKISSKNGILYCNGDVAFVPDNNPYAETLPLKPLHGFYKKDFCDLENFCLEGYGQDLFGGIYSLDGKRFLRYDGMTNRQAYRVREGVEEIFDKAFWVVTGLGNGDHGLPLRTIELPQSLIHIGKESFRASSLQKINIPDGVLSMEDGAFLNCQSLESVAIPKALQKIGERALAGSGIKSIVIPKDVRHIGIGCFDRCYQLSTIEVAEGNRYYSSEEGVLFNHDKSSLIRVPTNLYADSPENANERKDIEPWHWKDCKCEKDDIVHFKDFYEGITYVDVEDKETGKKYKEIISKEGVYLSPSVNLVHLCLPPGSRVYVDEGEHVKAGTIICSYQETESQEDWRPFYGFTRKRYAIPGTVKRLEAESLNWCPIQELTIPSSVEFIGEKALIENNFVEITVSPENKHYETRNHCLIDKTQKALICRFGKNKDITIPDGVEIIKDSAFELCSTPCLVIPEGVTYIEDNSFSFIRTKKIILPTSICYIHPHAFTGLYDCSMQLYNEEFRISVPKGLKDKYIKLLFDDEGYVDKYFEEREINIAEDGFNIELYKTLAATSVETTSDTFVDEYGVQYSKDGKLLLSFGEKCELSYYHVKEGTEVICDNASAKLLDAIHLPASLEYVGNESIFANTIIIDGSDTCFAPESLCLDIDSFIYIPCGTWARYRSIFENAKYHDDEDEGADWERKWREEYNDYHLIELSKTNVMGNLREQLYILTSIIDQKQLLNNYSTHYPNGEEGIELVCLRTSNQSRYFVDNSHCYKKYALYLSALGYDLDKVTYLLGIQIDVIEVKNGCIESAIGHKLAFPVLMKWVEEFSDEYTGDIESIERCEVIIDAGIDITDDHIELIRKAGVEKVYVYHEFYYDNHLGLVSLLVEADVDEWKKLYPQLYVQDRNAAYDAVLKDLFPFKKPDNITEEEKNELAYNIVKVIKGIKEHPDSISDMILPLKVSCDNVHLEMTSEEQILYRLIVHFYNEAIRQVADCKSDIEVIKTFKDKSEIQNLLSNRKKITWYDYHSSKEVFSP